MKLCDIASNFIMIDKLLILLTLYQFHKIKILQARNNCCTKTFSICSICKVLYKTLLIFAAHYAFESSAPKHINQNFFKLEGLKCPFLKIMKGNQKTTSLNSVLCKLAPGDVKAPKEVRVVFESVDRRLQHVRILEQSLQPKNF